ncbi:hypothetical protein HELRODRAFT_173115 [Helobdella robusta]|uniref:Uncharacterized protein n=1 Tax=Helobdella robusta TaxID=6412 RepID=T1F6D9_HELRO|nr:hypothetical protein HELRODRAFT_173115 [Helobdella robusta]ESO04044.1 hypothetical protein HELRODRAFT_173115 [Helobdella robusta]
MDRSTRLKTNNQEEESKLDPVQALQMKIMEEEGKLRMKLAEEAKQKEEERKSRLMLEEKERKWRMKLEEEDRRIRREADSRRIERRVGPMIDMCPSDPQRIAPYFQLIEGVFEKFQVEDSLKVEILLSKLDVKMRNVMNELNTDERYDYEVYSANQRSKTTSMPGNNNQNGFQNKISNNDTFKHDHAFNNPVNKPNKIIQLYLKNLQTNNKSTGVMRGESFVNHRVKKNQVRDRKNNYARSNDNNNNNNMTTTCSTTPAIL